MKKLFLVAGMLAGSFLYSQVAAAASGDCGFYGYDSNGKAMYYDCDSVDMNQNIGSLGNLSGNFTGGTTATKKSFDIYYRDAVWTSNTQKNSTPVQASSLSEAASAIQTAWAPKYATCSGNSSANTVSCTCDTEEAGVQYFWLGSNCITFASSHPGVCYKAGTYYSSYDSSGSPGSDCNTAYEECPADCAACTASGGVQCTRCKSGYYIYNGECVSSCPSGYAPENGECVEAAEDPDPMSGSCPSPLKLSSDGCCCVK